MHILEAVTLCHDESCCMHAQIVPSFRVRIIPVLGTMPAIFGLAAASHVLCTLAGQPFQSEPVFRLLEAQYETQLQRLTEREELVHGNFEGPAVDLDDVRMMPLHAPFRKPPSPDINSIAADCFKCNPCPPFSLPARPTLLVFCCFATY